METRVTWRRVPTRKGGGYDGIASNGRRVFVAYHAPVPPLVRGEWEFGTAVAAVRVTHGRRGILLEAKLAAEALAASLKSGPHPRPVHANTQPKGGPMAPTQEETAPAVEAAPEAPAKAKYDDLFETLMAAVKDRGATVEEKVAYVRVNLGKPTVVYANKPTRTGIRLEIPKVKGSGYDVVKVTTESQLNKGLDTAFSRAAKKQEAAAPQAS